MQRASPTQLFRRKQASERLCVATMRFQPMSEVLERFRSGYAPSPAASLPSVDLFDSFRELPALLPVQDSPHNRLGSHDIWCGVGNQVQYIRRDFEQVSPDGLCPGWMARRSDDVRDLRVRDAGEQIADESLLEQDMRRPNPSRCQNFSAAIYRRLQALKCLTNNRDGICWAHTLQDAATLTVRRVTTVAVSWQGIRPSWRGHQKGVLQRVGRGILREPVARPPAAGAT